MTRLAASLALAWLAFAGLACNRHGEAQRLPSVRLYSSTAITATVADSVTGLPVPGAAVVVVWRRIETYSLRWDGIFRIAQAVTSPDGSFTIPRWGPRQLTRDAYLDARGPEIWVVRRGYVATFFDQEGRRDLSAISSADGKSFVILPPDKDRRKQRFERALEAGCIWDGRNLLLRKAHDADEEAAALAIANPLDPYLNPLDDIPLYWSEWKAAREMLPSELRATVPHPPRHATDFIIVSSH